MKKYLSFPYFYLFLWIVFSIFPYVYDSTKLYKFLMYFFSGTALYYTFYSIAKYKLPVYFKTTYLFSFILLLYGLILVTLGKEIFWQHLGAFVESNRYIVWHTISFLTVAPIYVFVCEGKITKKEMKYIFFVMLFCCIFVYYGSIKILKAVALETGVEQDQFVVTCVYSLLSILPLIVLFKKKIFIQMMLLSLFCVYFVLSAKRGPIILGGICSIILIFDIFRNSSIEKKIGYMLILLCFMVGLYEFIMNLLQTNSFFAYRVDQTMTGYTSGRDEYVRTIMDYFNNVPIWNYLFGIGAQGTLSVNVSFAHNDWIAILLEQGIFGLSFFVIYWIGFFYSWFKSNYVNEVFVGIGLLLLIGLGKTFFSMYYLPVSQEMMMSSGFYAIALGYFLAQAFPQSFCMDEK